MNILWFRDISKKDSSLVGEKAAYLAELNNSEYPVPPGFVITNSAFLKFLQDTSLSSTINHLINNSNLEDKNILINVSAKIQEIILASKIPENLVSEILESYENLHVNIDLFKSASAQALNILKASRDLAYVSVRLSPEIKIEGISFLNIANSDNLIKTIKRCWAYLFTPDLLYKTKGSIRSSIIIQKMVDANKSGIIETSNDEIKIKSCYGLSESKQITFDTYLVSRDNFEIISKQINKQNFCILKDINLGKSVRRNLFDYEASSQKLDDAEIRRLAKISSLIEELFNSHVLVEFAIEHGKLYFLQVLTITKEIQVPKVTEKSYLPVFPETITNLRIYSNKINQEDLEKSDGIGLLTCSSDSLLDITPSLNNKSAWFLCTDLEKEMPFIKQCHDSGFNNIGIILPMINSTEQVRKAKDIIRVSGLEPLEEIEFGIIIETPEAVQNIEGIANEYIDFVSIDLDNLIKSTLSSSNFPVSRINPAVLRQLKHVIKICKENNIEVCVLGSILDNLEIAEFLVRLGADTLIINPSNLLDTRKVVEKAERKMLLDVARKSSS